MAKKKPGVMIYFDPLHKEVYALDDHRAARLFRAILDHANPECEKEPDFSDDEILSHVWTFVQSDVDRDDETYRRKVGNQYSAFCRFCKENGYGGFADDGKYLPPLTRAEWDEAGQPTYKLWSKTTLLSPSRQTHTNDANAYARMQAHETHTDAYARMQTHETHSAQENALQRTSDTASKADAVSSSGTDAGLVSGAPCADGARDTQLSPGILRDAFLKWKNHWEELHRQAMPSSTRSALADEMRNYAEEYNPYVVASFVERCMASGYKSLPWDRMVREYEAHNREMEASAERDIRRGM